MVKVPLPLSRTRYPSEGDAPVLEIKFVHWDLCELIKSGVQDFASLHNFHWRGFKQFWKPSEGKPEQQVFGEVYTSDTFLDMESKLPHIKGCHRLGMWTNCPHLGSLIVLLSRLHLAPIPSPLVLVQRVIATCLSCPGTGLGPRSVPCL